MKSLNGYIYPWLLVMALTILVACAEPESTPAAAEARVTETAEPTTTATPSPPTPTATAVLPTPTATATEAPPTVESTSTPLPVALCPGEVGAELTWTCEENSRDGTRRCTAVDPEPQFACYEDLTHGFALSLLNNWTTGAEVYQRPPYRERDKFVKYHDIFFNNDNEELEDAFTRLLIFVPTERNLADWMAIKRWISPDMFPITEINASVAGHPAIIWINNCSPFYRDVEVLVHNGARVFWWRHYAYREAGVLGLRQLLDSMRFTEETAVPSEIPDEIWQEALQGCW
jgi:hypothetical protein